MGHLPNFKAKLVTDFYKLAPDSLAIELDSNIEKFCIACVYRSLNLSPSLNRVRVPYTVRSFIF